MAKVNIQKSDHDHLPQDVNEQIRKKAFELFERRGCEPGKELDDWFQAEHELFWVPQAELAESPTEFKLEVEVPGLNAKDVEVTAEPHTILVRNHTDEIGEKSLYCRVALAVPLDLDRITGQVDHGTLTIVAPKMMGATA